MAAPGFTKAGVSKFADRDLGCRRITCEVGKPLAQQAQIGHNRWHPGITPIAELAPGESIIIETAGYDDYQLQDNDDVSDVVNMDLGRVHPIGGPIYVKGAEPGDLLVVDVLEISPLSGVGYSAIIPEIGGLLKDVFSKGWKSVWYMRGDVYAESRHVPGVRIPALPHPGVIGVAPSPEMLRLWNEREAPLVAKGQAYGPNPDTAVLRGTSGSSFASMAAEAARTVPPRENGGNMDIKNLSPGAKIFFPVFVPGALLSVGDLHFAEGDGEATWNAIEMDGISWLRVNLVKGGTAKYGIKTPIFQQGPVEPNFGNRFITFTGFCFRGKEQAFNDATMATREAMLRAIEYLTKFGYTGEQAYTILSVAPIELRVSGIVDVPNCGITLYLPLDIFDKDIMPR